MKKVFHEWRWFVVGLVFVTILALVLRIYNLTILPVFADEAIYVRWAQVMKAEPTLRFLPSSDGKQPLYMWILMFVIGRLSDPLFTGRLLSAISGIGTILGIFALCYLLFKNKKVALISAFIWSLSPFSLFFDRMALVDSLLAMFVVWTSFFALLTARHLRLDLAMVTGFLLGFALLTKSPALFVSVLIPTTALFIEKPKNIWKFILLIIPIYLIGYGMQNILRLGPNYHLLTNRNYDYVFPLNHLWTNPKDPFIFHVKEFFTDWAIKMGTWPILVISGIGIFVLIKNKKYREMLFLTLWFLGPLLIESMYAKVFTVRYVLFTLPYLFILTSTPFLSLNKNIIKTAYVLTAILLVLNIKFNYILLTNPAKANLPSSERSGYLEEWTAGHGIKEVSEYLINESKSSNIVVGTEGYFGTLPDGLQMYVEGNKNITVFGVGLELKDVPQSLKDSQKAGNKTYLVINSSRIKIKEAEYSKKGLKLISTFKKPERREKMSREYILNGPFESLYFFEIIEPLINENI